MKNINKNDNKNKNGKIQKSTSNSQMIKLDEQDFVYTLFADINRESLKQLYIDFSQLGDVKMDSLYFILCSNGGSPSCAFEMAYYLQKYAKRIIGLIPSYAYSSSVILALSFHEIQMSSFSYMGPMDTQTPSYSAGLGFGYNSTENIEACYNAVIDYGVRGLDKTVELILKKTDLSASESINLSKSVMNAVMEPVLTKIDPKDLGDYHRACKLASSYGVRVLKDIHDMDINDAWKLCGDLTKKYPTHGFHIKETELKKIGLPIKTPLKIDLKYMDRLAFQLDEIDNFQGFSKVRSQDSIIPNMAA